MRRVVPVLALFVGCRDDDAVGPSQTSESTTTGSSDSSTAIDVGNSEVSSTSSSGGGGESDDESGVRPDLPMELCDAYDRVEDYLDLSSQTEVRASAGVECVAAGVSIWRGPDEDLVDDLGPLSSLQRVGGPFTVGGTTLTNLTGLEALEWVGGDLNIGAALPDAGGCATNLNLQNLDALAALQRFDNLRICGGVGGSLVSIDGLDAALEGDVVGLIALGGLAELTSIAPFEGVTSIGGGLAIVDLPTLADLAPLHDVESAAALTLGGTGVVDLVGLESLTTVDFRLAIVGNPSLATLAGLDALAACDELFITDNASLPQAEAEAFAATVDVAGQVVICGNLGGPPC